MLFVLLFTIVLISVCVALVWPRHGDLPEVTGLPTAHAPRTTAPETLEGIVVGQLMTGGISRQQYRRAMCHLAARDAERHPLEVPPDMVPPDSA